MQDSTEQRRRTAVIEIHPEDLHKLTERYDGPGRAEARSVYLAMIEVINEPGGPYLTLRQLQRTTAERAGVSPTVLGRVARELESLGVLHVLDDGWWLR